MKIDINVEFLISRQLSANQYVLCFLLYQKDFKLAQEVFDASFKYYRRELDDLLDKGLLLRKASAILSIDHISLNEGQFIKLVQLTNPIGWIDEWFDLWPQGVRSGGYYVRTDRMGCLKKMKTFAKRYPEFNSEIIMQATKAYLDSLKPEGYAYVKLAPNFIDKDGISTLAGECQSIIDRLNKPQLSSNKETDLFGEREI